MSGSHASSGASAAPGDCPTDDVIAAHVGGKLDDVERERVSAHLDGCANCRDLVIHAVRGVHADPLAATRPADAVTTSGDSAHVEGERTPIPSVFAGRYELKRLIGTGGMGSVYEALDLNLHRLVALKVLKIAPSKPEERAEAVNRLVREARAMAVLSHKNVVVVYDVGFHEDQVFVAMQLVDGLTLREWLTTETRTTSQVLRVLFDAGSGLAAAHAARLIHRDFKPDNILISQRGTARVTDFGLARRADLVSDLLTTTERISAPKVIDVADGASVTRSGAIVGTPAYMAPEQAKGDPCDARADQFSFSVTAWEALHGNRPFAGSTWSEIYVNVVNQQLSPQVSRRVVPRAIQRALRRGLAASPTDRFPSMTELLAVFQSALRLPRRIRRLVITGVALIAIAVAIFVTRRVSREATPPDDVASAPSSWQPVTVDLPNRSWTPPAPPDVPALFFVWPEPTSDPSSDDGSKPRPTRTPDPSSDDGSKPKPTRTPDPSSDEGSKPARVADPSSDEGSKPDPSSDEGSKPAPDQRLPALASARRTIDTAWQQRDLLRGDLPAGFATALREADAALATGDASRAAVALDQAKAIVAGVVIDRAFVDQKLQRLNSRLQKLPADQREASAALLRDVLALVNNGEHAGANRKLNQIVVRLGLGADE